MCHSDIDYIVAADWICYYISVIVGTFDRSSFMSREY